MNCLKCNSPITKIHHPDFLCYACGYEFKLSYNMGKNYDMKSRVNPSTKRLDENWLCENCNHKFETEEQLMEHEMFYKVESMLNE